MNYLKNEMVKIWNIKKILIVIILFLIPNIFWISVCDKTTIHNWREKAESLRADYEEYDDSSDGEMFSQYIEKIDYCLENNVPYNVNDAWKQTKTMNAISNIVLMVILIFAVKVFSIEFENKTWKNLFATGMSKTRLQFIKIIYAYIQSLIMLWAFFAFSFGVAAVTLGVCKNPVEIQVINNQVVEISLIESVLHFYFIKSIQLILYVSIAMFTSVLFKDKKMSLIITLAVLFVQGIFGIVLERLNLNRVLLFKCLQIGDFDTLNEFILVIAVLLCYSILLIAFTVIRFNREEI